MLLLIKCLLSENGLPRTKYYGSLNKKPELLVRVQILHAFHTDPCENSLYILTTDDSLINNRIVFFSLFKQNGFVWAYFVQNTYTTLFIKVKRTRQVYALPGAHAFTECARSNRDVSRGCGAGARDLSVRLKIESSNLAHTASFLFFTLR